MNNNLFDDFDAVSSKQWKQKIQFDLNGADYNNTLVWKSNEDIHVKPFYHADDLNKLPERSNTRASEWKICQTIFVADIYTLAHANEYLNALNQSKTNLKSLNAIFNVSIGPNYFFEIAKLRALRKLWHILALEYGSNTNCHIVATPTKRNKYSKGTRPI